MAADDQGVVLCAAGATRRYQNILALDHVSLKVAPGEVYVLIGRNGAGKSTLAKAAIGALALDEGSILIHGEDPSRRASARQMIGVAPQEIALWGHLTIEENLDAFAALAGVPSSARAKAVVTAMEATCCFQRRAQRVAALSGGWRRRANLAAAIVHSPKLLVLDEPTEGLDAEMKMSLHALVKKLRINGVAVLLISHDQETVAALADRVGVLVSGRLVAEGRPEVLEAKAFGRRRQVTVRAVGGTQHAGVLLGQMGLALDSGGAWTGLMEDAMNRAREIDQGLRAAQIRVSELRVSSPGLDGLIEWAAGLESF